MSDLETAKLGAKVPDIEVETYEPGKRDFGNLKLSDVQKDGKWTILVFYPADFTFVCATEFAALAEQQDKFAELGAKLVTVSTDTKFVHLAWRDHEGSLKDVKYTMAADATAALSKAFGVYDPATGLALRGTFIINPEGVLMSSEVNFYNLGRNIDELMRKFEANLYLAEHGDQGCPAKWKGKGDKTLTPGPELVGKVQEALNG